VRLEILPGYGKTEHQVCRKKPGARSVSEPRAEPGVSALRRTFASLLSAFLPGILLLCSPGGKIPPDSQTEACADEVTGALLAFSREMGLAYTVEAGDARSIFQSGQVAKSYFRDGVRYTAHFGLLKTQGGCNLKFFKRSTGQPGQFESTTGSYGTVSLEVCRCE